MAESAAEIPRQQEQTASSQASERRCEICETKLSKYNPGPNCWQHTIGHPWRGPTAKPKY